MSDSVKSSPLRIAVVGVGGIGSAFAFQLARMGGHAVTAIARPGSRRLEQLLRDEGVVNSAGEYAEMQIADSLDETVEYDLVLVTLLNHQVDAVLPSLERSRARWIQFMFNQFDPERLQNAVGADRSSCGMPFLQARVNGEGRLEAKIGAGGQKSKMSDARWVKVFADAGLPAVLEPKMMLWLRCHVPLCIAFESVSVAGVRRGGGASWGEAMMLARGVRESFLLIERLGYEVYPHGKRMLQASPGFATAAMLWTMSRIGPFRELLATGKAECCALVDVLVARSVDAMPSVAVSRIEAMKP